MQESTLKSETQKHFILPQAATSQIRYRTFLASEKGPLCLKIFSSAVLGRKNDWS